MRIHLETATDKQLKDFYKLGIIGKRALIKHLNQHYKRPNQRSFKSSIDRGSSQAFRRELGKKNYLRFKGQTPTPYENKPLTTIRKPQEE